MRLHLIEVEWESKQRALIHVSKVSIRKIASERASTRQHSSLARRKRKHRDRGAGFYQETLRVLLILRCARFTMVWE